ncbi:MAG: hypothetical protein WKF47_17950 [Geodermatophilaceae bacterium]
MASAPVPRVRSRYGADRGGIAKADRRRAGDRSALGRVFGWFVFVIELVVAAVLGVLIWYAFGLLWELYPYAAAVAAAVVLSGLVTAGQVLRRWRSQDPLGPMAVAALLLVAAFLVVLPAAAVLTRG